MPNSIAFLGGPVFTADARTSIATGVYAEDGRIKAVGDEAEVRPLVPPGTRIVDLAGKTLVPGFIDAHCHPIMFGGALGEIDARYPTVSNVEDLATAISETVAATPEGGWVRGWGLDYDKFPGGRLPTRWEIDEISPHNPVFILHVSGHNALVNSTALQLAGVGDNAPDPPGGAFVRDGRGRLTGVLLDAAQQVVLKSSVEIGNHGPSAGIYDAPLEELVGQMERGYDAFLRAGITSAVDAQVTRRELRAYIAAQRSGRLPVRTTCMLLSNHLRDVEALGVTAPLGDDWLALGAMKFYADGSLSGSTAAFSEPYHHREPEFRGITYWSPEDLAELVTRSHRLGNQVGIHAQGDRGIQMALDAIEAALKAEPREDHRDRIEHGGYPSEPDLARAARLGVTLISNPRYLYEVGDTFQKNLGPERARRITPLRSELDLGMPIVFGSDIPVASYKPLDILWTAVTRRSLAGADMGSGERVTVVEGLRAQTINAARSFFQEDRRGSIEAGKLADFTLVGGDLLNCPVDDIPSLPVEMTVIDGRVVYEATPEKP